MWNYICIVWLINWSDSTKMHGATIRFIYIYISKLNTSVKINCEGSKLTADFCLRLISCQNAVSGK